MLLNPAEADTTLTARVAIVGSGPAGLALGLMLAEAGVDVVVLESGLTKSSSFAASLSTAADAPENDALPESLGGRRFGGLSWTWGGRCVPYDPIDFTPRPGAEVPGWPISYAEALQTASQAADFLDIGAADFRSADETLNGGAIRTAIERWSAEPRLTKRHNRALRANRGLKIQLGASCTAINIDGHGHVLSLTAKTIAGRTISVRADFFVVAAGGIENARLLLWAFERLPTHARSRWLGHGYMGHLSGHIARVSLPPDIVTALDYFVAPEGCFARRRFVVDPNIAKAERLLNIVFHIDNPTIRDPEHGSPGLSASALALSTPGIRSLLFSRQMRDVLVGDAPTTRELGAHLANIARAPLEAVRFGARGFLGRVRKPVRPGVIDTRFAGALSLGFYAEQLADHASYVELSGATDALGMPRVKIVRRAGETEVASVLRAHELLEQHLWALGADHFGYFASPQARAQGVVDQSGDGVHQIGLTRMGRTTTDSVVDANARVHGIANLFVAGSAVFPTSGQANPTFMIVCQALRLGHHLIRQISRDTRAAQGNNIP
ncbi:MAG: GMC family oxidoreductase [Hyphomicrobiales bacterium]|nr:GMC family oxidoreductase [Hyphomicrobiales bacterium]